MIARLLEWWHRPRCVMCGHKLKGQYPNREGGPYGQMCRFGSVMIVGHHAPLDPSIPPVTRLPPPPPAKRPTHGFWGDER